MIITPDIKDPDVVKLIQLVDANTEPIVLSVEPEPYSQIAECFPAVEEKVKKDGGKQLNGWQIWKSKILVEAEFHAVWKSPDGSLKDITPKRNKATQILFLPDPNTKYNKIQVDNIRMNISGNRLVDDFIEIAKAIFRLENKGNRAFQHRLELHGSDAETYKSLYLLKAAIYSMIQSGKTRNSECFCNEGLKYKHCHGKDLMKILNRI